MRFGVPVEGGGDEASARTGEVPGRRQETVHHADLVSATLGRPGGRHRSTLTDHVDRHHRRPPGPRRDRSRLPGGGVTHAAHARALLEAADRGAARSCGTSWPALGWLGLHVPEAHGGSGYGLEELVVVVEELGRAVAPGPFVPTVIASAVLAPTADDETRPRLLPGLVDGSVDRCGRARAATVTVDGRNRVGRRGHRARRRPRPRAARRRRATTSRSCRSATASPSRVPPNLDPTRRSARVTLDGAPATVIPGARQTLVDLARVILVGRGRRARTASAPRWPPTTPRSGCSSVDRSRCTRPSSTTAPTWSWPPSWPPAPSGTPPGPRPTGGDQLTYAAAVAATLAAPGGRPVRQPQHPGARRHRHHLGARRPPLHAPGDRRCSALLERRRGRGRPHRPHPPGRACATRPSSCPPEAEAIRDEVRTFAERIKDLLGRRAAHPADRDRLRDAALAQAVGPRGRRRRAARDRAGVRAQPASSRPAYGITGVGHPHAHPVRHRRPGRPVGAARRSNQEVIWCQLFSEPDAGSDAAGVKTKATRVDGGWLVNGQKVWTSGAHVAGMGFATVRTNPDVPKHEGITTMVIDMHAEGVEVRPLQDDHRQLGVQRGVLQRRVRARRRRRRAGRRRLDGGPRHARQRERQHRRRRGRHVAARPRRSSTSFDAHPERLAGGAGRIGRYVADAPGDGAAQPAQRQPGRRRRRARARGRHHQAGAVRDSATRRPRSSPSCNGPDARVHGRRRRR